MNNLSKNIIVALFTLTLPLLSYSQYCNNFHESFCEPSENELYKPNGQSKSALFGKGQTSELSVIVYKGQDYRISLCMDQNLGSSMEFKIYENKKVKVEKVTETKEMEDVLDENGEPTGEQREVVSKQTSVVYEKQKTLLYDNTQDNLATELEFSVETTQRLIFEISIPNEGGSGKSSVSKGKGKLVKSSDMGCVGILIEHMTTPKTGFYGTGF